MRLLVIEDERKVADFIARRLRDEDWTVDTAYDGEQGWGMARLCQYDLVILDLMLPGINGTEILRRLRKKDPHLPVLVLTARNVTEKNGQNLDGGADDVLTKPFAFAELLVRVKALLQRGPVNGASVLRVGDLEIDRLSKQVKRRGAAIELTAQEYALLEYLACNAGQVLSRSMIVDHVWDQSFEGATNIVDVYIRHLRTKIDGAFPEKLIRTIRGIGYSVAEGVEH